MKNAESSTTQNAHSSASPSKLLARIGLALLLLAQLGLAVAWLAEDQTPPFWDHAAHGRDAIKSGHAIWRDVPPLRGRILPDDLREETVAHPALARLVLGPLAGPANWAEAFYRGAEYPPLAYVVAGLGHPLIGDSPDALAIGLGTLWWLAALLATYLLAARAFGEVMGLVAAVALAGMPGALGLSRSVMVDEALVATTAAAAWLLIRSNGFQDRRSSLLLGLALGLGMLAKQTFIILMGPAILWEALRAFGARRRHEAEGAIRIQNLGASLLVAAFVAAPWYVPYLPSSLSDPIRFGLVLDALSGEAVAPAVDPWLYIRDLMKHDMGPFALALSTLGMVILSFQTRPAGGRALVFGCFVAFLFYTFIFPIRHGRLIVAFLPIAAFAITALIHSLPSRIFRFAMGVAVFVMASLTTVGSTVVDLGERHSSVPLMGGSTRWVSLRSFMVNPPKPGDWGHTRVLEAIRTDHGPGPIQTLVIQEGFDYHGELMVRTTMDESRRGDRVLPEGLLITMHAHKLQPHQPYYLVVALQRPLGSSGVGISDYQWIAETEQTILQQSDQFREVLRMEDLPSNMEVTVYHNAEGKN